MLLVAVEYKLNIIHILMALGALGCLGLVVREADRRSMKPARIYMPPVLAGLAALLMLFIALHNAVPRQLTIESIFVGLTIGAARGTFMALEVDQVLTRLRMPTGRDGMWVAFVHVAAAAYQLATAWLGEELYSIQFLPLALSLTAAAYLIARAFAVQLRIYYSPHIDFD